MEPHASEQRTRALEGAERGLARSVGHYSMDDKSYHIRLIDLAAIDRQKKPESNSKVSALIAASALITSPALNQQDARSARIESELSQRVIGHRTEKKPFIKTPASNSRKSIIEHEADVPNHLATKISILPLPHQYLAKSIIKKLKNLEKNNKINGMKFLKALKTLDTILEQPQQLRENNLKALDRKCGGSLT